MKIILSRKGFDGTSGGMSSPIFEDGTMVSFPIPSGFDEDEYTKLSYRDEPYLKILKDLDSKKKKTKDWDNMHCHLDPDLDQERRSKKVDGWMPAFGQNGPMVGYLNNAGVKEGDLFLFFGNFHLVRKKDGKYRYVGKKQSDCFYENSDLQVIWGYLQIGDIIYEPEKQDKFNWHPHVNEKYEKNNVIFEASKCLSFAPEMSGAGVLKFDKKRVLTAQNCSMAKWIKNNVYDNDHIVGKRNNSANDDEKEKVIYYRGRWQELALEESDACTKWAKNMIL